MGTDRPHGGLQQQFGGDRPGSDRHRRLRPVAGADRLSPDRGSGLPAGGRAVAGRRIARAHPAGARSGQRHRRQDAGRGAGDRHRRDFGARQQREPRQWRRGLSDPQGLGRARGGRGFALAGGRAEPENGGNPAGADHRASAAADPGYRQCRRLRHAGRAARRQRRFRQAAGHHQCRGRRRSNPECAAAGEFAVPFHGAAIRCESGPDQDPDAARHHRPGVLDAGLLSGIFLRRPVQQIRPHLPDLYPGRRAIPPDPARYREF